MPEDINALKQKLKRLELEEKLKKLGGSHSHKTKVIQSSSNEDKVKREIAELESKKAESLKRADSSYKGKGFLGRIGVGLGAGLEQIKINKQINEKRGYIQRENQIKNLQQVNRLQEIQIEANKKKAELRKARQLNTEQIQSFKGISQKDIFG